jgi:hypothetical protein
MTTLELTVELFNKNIPFLESCKNHPHGDKLIHIFEKRTDEGILPKENYSTNEYDYTRDLGDLSFFLKDFDELYYPKQLVSDEISSKVNDQIENLKKLSKIVLSLNGDNFDTPDSAFIFLSEVGRCFYQFDVDVNSILYESKKDIFRYVLHKKVNSFLSKLNINTLSFEDIDAILKKDNKDNSIHFELYSLNSYLRDNHKIVESIFSNIDTFEKMINSTIWCVYSYEMRFYDHFIEIKNKYDQLFREKLEELQTELSKKFTIIKTIELDDGTVEEETVDLLEKAFEFYENIEDKFSESVESKIDSLNSSSEEVEAIISQEINKIIGSLDDMTPMRETMIRNYLGISSSLISMNQSFAKMIDFFEKKMIVKN